MKKSIRHASLVLGASVLMQVQGCYGSFNLTRKVYAWIASSAGSQNRLIEMVGEDGRMADLVYPDGRKQRVELAME